MEKIIGILDEQVEFAERFKGYINGRRDIGCFAVTFQNEQEVLSFCEKKKLSCLVTGEKMAQRLEELPVGPPCGVQVWVLSEEAPEVSECGGHGVLFRYQRAGEIIRRILALEAEKTECMSALLTVFSPENGKTAMQYSKRLISKLQEQGRTLFLPWDAFCGYGRKEEGEAQGVSVSELLYLIRRDRKQARQLFRELPKKEGAEYFCGPDYCTDLWQYSAEEMRQLIYCCREYGEYKQVVFLAGTFQEAVLAVMKLSSKIYLVTSGSVDGEQRKKEFLRQMKYAGEQEILSRLTEVTEAQEQGESAWKS